MKYKEIIDGIKAGTIKIRLNGHMPNPLIDTLERYYDHWFKSEEEYLDKIINNVGLEKDEPKHEDMLKIYQHYLNKDYEIGQKLAETESYCFNCDSNLLIFLNAENEVVLIDIPFYYNHPERGNNFRLKEKDIQPCSCSTICDQKKLVSRIEVPSGKLVFQNYFNTEDLYCDKENEWRKPGINSILGRNKLMQHLASKKNVGYVQMGNMGISIYSNNKDQVIIGDSLDGYHDNKHYYDKNPDCIDDKWLKIEKDAQAFMRDIKGFTKNKKRISLSVWRWMCADVETLKKHNEKPGENSVIVKVEPGTYEIEHYYDFPENGDFLYSKITKVKVN